MKNILFLFTFLLFSSVSFSQEKLSLAILSFNNSGNASSGDVNTIQETVTNTFVKTKRFNIVDRTKMEALKREKELQKTEDFMDGAVIEQGKSLGAKFVISGKVVSVNKSRSMKERTKLDGTKESYEAFEATINFVCQIIDVETGQVVNSETFSNDGGGTFLGMSMAKNLDDAFSSSLNSLQKDLDKWVGKNFPLTITIVEIQEKDSKGNAKKILIAGGSSVGLEKGEKLKVVEVLMVDVNGVQKERKKEIGEVKISKIEDESFSVCTVTSGGIDINTKFEAKSKLLVVTVK